MIRNRSTNVSIRNAKKRNAAPPPTSKDHEGYEPDVKSMILPVILIIEKALASTTLRKNRILNFKSVLLWCIPRRAKKPVIN